MQIPRSFRLLEELDKGEKVRMIPGMPDEQSVSQSHLSTANKDLVGTTYCDATGLFVISVLIRASGTALSATAWRMQRTFT